MGAYGVIELLRKNNLFSDDLYKMSRSIFGESSVKFVSRDYLGKKSGEMPPTEVGQNTTFRHARDQEAIMAMLSAFGDIVPEMKKKFPGFLGILNVDSLAKGYATRDSDYDITIVGGDDRAEMRQFLDGKIDLDEHHYAFPDITNQRIDKIKNDKKVNLLYHDDFTAHTSLFMGSYIGDVNEFRNLQKILLSKINDDNWDAIRLRALNFELGAIKHEKAPERYSLQDPRALALKIILNKYLPPLDEMRARLEKINPEDAKSVNNPGS